VKTLATKIVMGHLSFIQTILLLNRLLIPPLQTSNYSATVYYQNKSCDIATYVDFRYLANCENPTIDLLQGNCTSELYTNDYYNYIKAGCLKTNSPLKIVNHLAPDADVLIISDHSFSRQFTLMIPVVFFL
jgi:hypothetical protein